MAQADRNKQARNMPPPIRRGRSAPVVQDCGGAAAQAFTRKGFADPSLVLRWSEIVGAEVAQLAVPVKLSKGANGGTLTLKVEPGASVFLQHETRTLCERINAYFGRPEVSRLRFVQSPLAMRPPPLPNRRPAKVPASDPAAAFEGAAGLRTALLSFARWRKA